MAAQETGPANLVDRAVGLGGGAVKGAVPVAVHLSPHELRPSTSETLCSASVAATAQKYNRVAFCLMSSWSRQHNELGQQTWSTVL